MTGVNIHGIWAIYKFEMARTLRTLWQSIVTPVVTTSLYFIVFGMGMGAHIKPIHDIAYGSFIVPGLIMLSLLTQSVANASIGIYFPKFTGTIFELLSAPISAVELVVGYVGAAATKSVVIGLIILATSVLFVPLRVDHPLAMIAFLLLTSIAFSMFGFIIGIWAKGFEQLNVVPALVLTPLTFLGGSFYPLSYLPQPWHTVSLFNPVAYLISGFRWAFFGDVGDIDVRWSLGFTTGFLLLCMGVIWLIFRTGYRLKS
ncbi:ABC transporter permease [Sphingomonas sp. LB-2]|uniref:ABC transporter permease n=1 Tax=Sphingomonas caeni TaxID=2984949 RepID=UPI00222F1FFD|nr:ABC transporter permease [Sphingomonas caeni]MCW3847106.1 ABC transporter permease [Sphingomonas caeni]